MADPNLLDVPAVVTFAGRDIFIQDPRDFQVEAEFTAWLQRQAYLAIERLRAEKNLLSLETYELHLAGWRTDCASGAYDWDSQASIRARFSHVGARQLAWLQIRRAEDLLAQQQKPVARRTTPHDFDQMWNDPKTQVRIKEIVWESKRNATVPPEEAAGETVEPPAA